MKLEELKRFLELSAKYQQKVNGCVTGTRNVSQMINEYKVLNFYRGMLIAIEPADKLNIDISVLSKNINEFFDKQNVLDASFSSAKYTKPSDKVLKGNIVGVVNVINNNGDKIEYELFDIVPSLASAVYTRGENGEKY